VDYFIHPIKTFDDPVIQNDPQATGSPIRAACLSFTYTVGEPEAKTEL
jgi:hypothetical protein